MRKAYQYRLYQTKQQAEQLAWILDRCRELYNAALEERREAYRMSGKTLGYCEQKRELPGLKAECPEYKEICSQVLQDVLKRVDLAFQAFFRRVRAGDKPGYPRFKSYHRYDSFTYSQAGWTLSADAAVLRITGGQRLFTGKIVDVIRRTERGFARGEATFQGLDGDEGHQLVIQFQNENLIALRDGAVVASVPDLITVLDAETGEPITTETLRYGFRVVVVGMPSAPAWRSDAGLALVGPRVFGYDVAYAPVAAPT